MKICLHSRKGRSVAIKKGVKIRLWQRLKKGVEAAIKYYYLVYRTGAMRWATPALCVWKCRAFVCWYVCFCVCECVNVRVSSRVCSHGLIVDGFAGLDTRFRKIRVQSWRQVGRVSPAQQMPVPPPARAFLPLCFVRNKVLKTSIF